MNNYLDTLNPRQREGVETVKGPVLIMAGAGSGKTKALTCRIAYMLEQGIYPNEILAITFTNKAAQEMRERVHNLVGPAADRIWMYTFHSFGARFLRREIASYPPYTDRFTIYDSDDSKTLVKNCLKELNLDDKQFQPNAMQNRISSAKNQLIDPKKYRELAGSNFFNQKAADVYELYDKHMKENNALDFDDLLYITTKLLSIETIRKRWQDRFHYILIDEYQDTNHAQYLMAKYIAGKTQNICAVGDADQSIYSWRGADLRNIMDFQKDYPKAKLIKLEQNYRSTQTILDAANAVIQNNPDRPSKRLWTENNAGTHLKHYTAIDEHAEANFIIETMQKEHTEKHRPYGDMAVLYRMNAQSRVIEEALVRRGIGYTMVGGTRFYDRAEIRDMLAYLKVINNFKDNISLARIINTPKRGIGGTTVQKLLDYANAGGMSMFEGIMAIEGSGLSSATQLKLTNFSAMIFDFLNASTEMNVFELIQKVMTDTKYLAQLQESKDPQVQSREENLGELLSVAKDFITEQPEGGLPEFLEKVALVNDVDSYEGEDDRVTLMTIHSAKGLEFPVVFVCGMSEGIFPGKRANTREKLEEERRLSYVAFTRAQDLLYLSDAAGKNYDGSFRYPSRFIFNAERENLDYVAELEPELLEEAKCHIGRTEALSAPPEETGIARGARVRHAVFGSGEVIGFAQDGRAYIIQFDAVATPRTLAVQSVQPA